MLAAAVVVVVIGGVVVSAENVADNESTYKDGATLQKNIYTVYMSTHLGLYIWESCPKKVVLSRPR